MRIEWLLCPICKSKTRLQLREDTELKNFPLYCPKCKQETLINAKDLQITVIQKREHWVCQEKCVSFFVSFFTSVNLFCDHSLIDLFCFFSFVQIFVEPIMKLLVL